MYNNYFRDKAMLAYREMWMQKLNSYSALRSKQTNVLTFKALAQSVQYELFWWVRKTVSVSPLSYNLAPPLPHIDLFPISLAMKFTFL